MRYLSAIVPLVLMETGGNLRCLRISVLLILIHVLVLEKLRIFIRK